MKRSGFTLIELLVVVAIIAILASILFPIFISAKEAGRTTHCMSNMRQITLAMLQYSDDNSGKLPALNAFTVAGGNVVHADPSLGAVYKYLNKSKKLLICPSDARRNPRFKVEGDPEATSREKKFTYSYTINGWLTWAPAHPPQYPNRERGKADRDGFPISFFKMPRRTPALVDENTDYLGGEYRINDQLFIWEDITGYKHRDRANLTYLDGHAGQVKGGLKWKNATWPDGTWMFYPDLPPGYANP